MPDDSKDQEFPLDEILARADRRFQREAALLRLARSVKWWGVVPGLLFVLDLLFQFSPAWRLVLLITVVMGCLGGLGMLAYRAFIYRARPEATARRLEEQHPHLGSRLINTLQLRHPSESQQRDPVTRQLLERALSHYRNDLATCGADGWGGEPDLKAGLKSGSIALGLLIISLLVLFPVTRVELLRFLDPYGGHAPFSFTRIDWIEPEERAEVEYGDPVIVHVKTAWHRPDSLFLSFHPVSDPDQVTTLTMIPKEGSRFTQQIPRVEEVIQVVAHTGNRRSSSSAREVGIILTPRLEEARVTTHYPDYTGLDSRERGYDFGSLTALEGSRLEFSLQSNRPLSGGIVRFSPPEGPPVEVELTPGDEDPRTVSGILPARSSGTLEFDLRDIDGRGLRERPVGRLALSLDLAPRIHFDTPEGDALVSEDFVIPVRASVHDDYGIGTFRIHRGVNEFYSSPRLPGVEMGERSAEDQFELDLAALGARAGETLCLFADASDSRPGEPNYSRSDVVRLQVISAQEYQQRLLKETRIAALTEKYGHLHDRLTDQINKQAALDEAIRKAREKLQETASSGTEEELEQLVRQQQQINRDLKALTEEMEALADTRKLYDVEEAFAELLKKEVGRIRSSANETDEAVKAATARQPVVPSSSLKALADASSRQLENLGAGQKQLETQVNDTIEKVALLDELIRELEFFRAMYDLQAHIAAQCRIFRNRTHLTEEDRLALNRLAEDQRTVETALARMPERILEKAERAEPTFPQAAASARNFGERVRKERLSTTAGRSGQALLAGQGPQSHALAEGLRHQMEAFFEQAESCQGGMCDSLDMFLTLLKGMKPGETYDQMAMSRLFPGMGTGTGSGVGMGGGGYSVAMNSQSLLGPNSGLLGGGRGSGSPGSVDSAAGGGGMASIRDGHEGAGSAEWPQQQVATEATTPDILIDEYSDLVDAYFQQITK